MSIKDKLIEAGVYNKIYKYNFESDISPYNGHFGIPVYLHSTGKVYRVGTGGTRDTMYEVHLEELSLEIALRFIKA